MEMFWMVQFTHCQVASGFMYRPQITRFCGAIGEQIQHQQSTVAPALGKTDAPTNSWIVHVLVSGRRIEANKRHRWQGFIPLPGESVAVDAVLRERRGCFHRVQVLDYFFFLAALRRAATCLRWILASAGCDLQMKYEAR